MSIGFIDRAIQVPYVVGPVAQGVFSNAVEKASFLGRIAVAVVNQFKDVTYTSGPFGITSSESLVNRAFIISAVGLSIATLILHYKAHPQQSKERKDCLHLFFYNMAFILGGWQANIHCIAACSALTSLIQFKNAYSVLPYLDKPDSPSSKLDQVGRVAYSALKYIAFLSISVGVFKASNKNLLNGALFFSLAFSLYKFSRFPTHVKDKDVIDLAEIKVFVGQSMGTQAASSLIIAAIASGIAGSVLYSSGLSCVSGIRTQDLYGVLGGVKKIILIVSCFPLIKRLFHQGYLVDKYSSEFIHRFSSAAFAAKRFQDAVGHPLSDYHYQHSYRLAFLFTAKKHGFDQQEQILEILRSLPENERFLHFVENHPFLNDQDIEGFIKAYEITALNLWTTLTTEQIRRFFFPPELVRLLDPKVLHDIEREIEDLQTALDAATKKYARVDLSKEEIELKIYEEIQQKHSKIVEYTFSIATLRYTINRMDPSEALLSETRLSLEHLRKILPQIAQLKEKIDEVENNIDDRTGYLITPVHEALGDKGFSVKDCHELFEVLGLPRSEKPFEDFSQMLIKRGIRNKYDLIKKGIFVLAENLEKFKERLLQFLLNSDQPLPSALDRAQINSAQGVAERAYEIYRYVAFPCFTALQFYAQPFWLTAGCIGGLVIHLRYPENVVLRHYRAIVDGFDTVVDQLDLSKFTKMAVRLAWNMQMMQGYLSGLGAFFALFYGPQLPIKIFSHIGYMRRNLPF